uniref:YidC/Oxa1 family membrane protein insertase n=1 Tax=Ndongobacter massiliensis TaxID=1871025 RepID=UPI0009F8071C|nr:YidC/Oxa1 family membrane protein insertase [Ndongobacter massiliensis]
MSILYQIFGAIMRQIYEFIITIGQEPKTISYFAITILLMAVLNKLITLPLTLRQARASKKMQDINPQLEALKKRYGYDERILQQKTMEFYKENKVSQVGCSSCLPMVIQLIIVLALFGIMRNPEQYLFDDPGMFAHIQKNFLWIQDLSLADPYWFALPLLNSASQILVSLLNPQMQQSQAAGGSSASSMRMMTYMMPVVFFFVFVNFQAALLLYWGFGNLLEVSIRLISRLFMRKTEPEPDRR